LPTLLFVLLVPRVLGIYHAISVRLTNWENHAQKSTYTASLTLKTFALSSLVAYLGHLRILLDLVQVTIPILQCPTMPLEGKNETLKDYIEVWNKFFFWTVPPNRDHEY
jgi:hypothetical protein